MVVGSLVGAACSNIVLAFAIVPFYIFFIVSGIPFLHFSRT